MQNYKIIFNLDEGMFNYDKADDRMVFADTAVAFKN